MLDNSRLGRLFFPPDSLFNSTQFFWISIGSGGGLGWPHLLTFPFVRSSLFLSLHLYGQKKNEINIEECQDCNTRIFLQCQRPLVCLLNRTGTIYKRPNQPFKRGVGYHPGGSRLFQLLTDAGPG